MHIKLAQLTILDALGSDEISAVSQFFSACASRIQCYGCDFLPRKNIACPLADHLYGEFS
jgi:hypothetical protein